MVIRHNKRIAYFGDHSVSQAVLLKQCFYILVKEFLVKIKYNSKYGNKRKRKPLDDSMRQRIFDSFKFYQLVLYDNSTGLKEEEDNEDKEEVKPSVHIEKASTGFNFRKVYIPRSLLFEESLLDNLKLYFYLYLKDSKLDHKLYQEKVNKDTGEIEVKWSSKLENAFDRIVNEDASILSIKADKDEGTKWINRVVRVLQKALYLGEEEEEDKTEPTDKKKSRSDLWREVQQSRKEKRERLREKTEEEREQIKFNNRVKSKPKLKRKIKQKV